MIIIWVEIYLSGFPQSSCILSFQVIGIIYNMNSLVFTLQVKWIEPLYPTFSISFSPIEAIGSSFWLTTCLHLLPNNRCYLMLHLILNSIGINWIIPKVWCNGPLWIVNLYNFVNFVCFVCEEPWDNFFKLNELNWITQNKYFWHIQLFDKDTQLYSRCFTYFDITITRSYQVIRYLQLHIKSNTWHLRQCHYLFIKKSEQMCVLVWNIEADLPCAWWKHYH